MLENPVKTHLWQQEWDDCPLMEPYKDLEFFDAALFAIHLADHGDAQRTEELQRTRRAQGQPRDRGHEEQRQPGRHDPERDARAQRAAGERGRTRAHEHQQEDTGPRETQP